MADRGPGGKFLPRGTKAPSTLSEKVAQADTAAAITATKSVKVEDIVKDISELQLGVQSKLNEVSSALTNRLTLLKNVETSISVLEARLNELHGIEAQAITLDDLRAQEENLLEAHERACSARNQQWAEENQEREKRWAREEDEHLYIRQQNQQKARDQFVAEMDMNKRGEVNRVEALTKNWAEREAILKSRETELTEAKAAVASFPEKLKSEVSKAEAILSNVLKRNHEHEMALLNRTAEGERALNKARLESVESQLKSKDIQLTELQSQLMQARADSKSVAEKALDAASGKEVTKALQQAMETQQPTQPAARR